MTINANIHALSFHGQALSAGPLTVFRHSLIGWDHSQFTFGFVFNFSEHRRVAIHMPYDGRIHSWAIKHGNFPNQQQGEWVWNLLVDGVPRSTILDLANPVNPFNPGPHEHLVDVFDFRPGLTDQPLTFKKGTDVAFSFGAKKGLFTITRNGAVSQSVTVFLEFLR